MTMCMFGTFTLVNNKTMSFIHKRQKTQFAAVDTPLGYIEEGDEGKSETFSECSFGTAIDNLWEAIDEAKEELALLTSEMLILKNLLEKVEVKCLGPLPPKLERQTHHVESSASHDAMSTDVTINCCMGNSTC